MDNKTPRIHYGYVILICCCLVMGVDVGLSMSCAGIFYQPVSSSIGASTGEFGMYMSISFLTSTLMLGVAGRMLERWSARVIITAASALLGVMMSLMSLMTQIYQFYLAGALIGVSLAFLLYLCFPTLINRWFSRRVGLLFGICSASSGIGGMLFNPLGGYILTGWGWERGYLVFGLIILAVVTPLLWLLLRDRPADKGLKPVGYAEGETAAADTSGIIYKDAVRMPSFYVLMAFGFMIMASSTLYLFLPKYASSVGYNIEEGALVAAGAMAGVTLGKIALGYINDRNIFLGVAMSTLTGILGLVMMMTVSGSLAAMIFGAFMFGWCYAAVTVQTAVLVRDVFGNRNYAQIFSVISMALAAGGTVASGAWGFIVDRTSFSFIFITGCVMLGICFFSGLWVIGRASANGRSHNR